MTTPLPRPRRKNPVLRTRQPTQPPGAASREALALTAIAAEGKFQLQTCKDCQSVQYPPRQLCGQCLSTRLSWQQQPSHGELLGETTLHHSNDLFFRERLPWRLGLVKLTCGPRVVVHLTEDCPRAGRVHLALKLDRSGHAVMLAMPPNPTPLLEDDRQMRETTCHPKHRRVLITDGMTPVGLALVPLLLEAGARMVFLGRSTPWKRMPDFEQLAAHELVTAYDLDVTDSESVRQLAAGIGEKVEILINTSYHIRDGGVLARKDINTPRTEMDVNYFGLLRLAREFGPVLHARGADGLYGASAWVNVLSIYARVAHPQFATYSASQAAALSLSQGLRADLRSGGVRVINLFPGPIEDDWHQRFPPPKISPQQLARRIVQALAEGVEDVYPDATSQEIARRLAINPKEVEHQLML